MTLWVDLACFLLYIQHLLGLESQRGQKEWSLQHWLAHMPRAWVGVAGEVASTVLLAHLTVPPAVCSPRPPPSHRSSHQGGNASFKWLKCKWHFHSHGPAVSPCDLIGSNVSWPPIKEAKNGSSAFSVSALDVFYGIFENSLHLS